MYRASPRKLLLTTSAALALLALPTSPAQAATSCTYDAAAAAVRVQIDGQGAAGRLSRTATGAIEVDGVACGGASTRTVDTIEVTGGSGPQQLLIDHSAGLFAPGKTAEAGQTSEIELSVDLGAGGELPLGDEVRIRGAATADYVRFGDSGAFLTADADADLATAGVEAFGAEGGAGNDRFLGTGDGAGGPASSLPLRLEGGDGADTLAGGRADDVIDGGAGSDVETGGDGRDRFRQGAIADGRDSIDGGGSPFDVIDYSQRTASVRIDLDGVADDGAAGELDNVKDAVEYLLGGEGADTIVASPARFQPFEIRGNGGDDDITGGSSHDELHGDAGDDVLRGLGGSDSFHGSPGDDTASGGAGGDWFYEGEGGVANGADDLSGDEGYDSYSLQDRTTPLTVTMGDGLANDGAAGEGDDIGPDLERIYTGAADDVVTGTDGADTIYTGPGEDTVDGGAGDDDLSASHGDDTVRGGTGEDRVWGDEGDDVVLEPSAVDREDMLDGGHGTDRISYAARTGAVAVSLDHNGNDGALDGEFDNALNFEAITGGAGGDVLQGGDGPDVLDGGPAGDLLEGGTERDRLVGGAGDDRLVGGAGRDLADYSDRVHPVTVTLGAGADDGVAGEKDSVDTEDVVGGSAGDTLKGSVVANTLDGGQGDDTLDGGLGGDTLTGGPGSDTASYAARTAPVAIRLDGAANDGAPGEADTIDRTVENGTGGGGADVLTGDDGPNALDGGPGDDTLDGSGGADVLDGGADRDTADYSGRGTAVSVSSDGNANDGTDTEGDGFGDERDRVLSTEILSGGTGNDILTGGRGDDELRGNRGDDRLAGGAFTTPAGADGHDRYHGGQGTDTVTYDWRGENDPVKVTVDDVANDGTPGVETDDVRTDVEELWGGSGDDELHGSAAPNLLWGGSGGKDALHGEGGDDRFDGGTDPRVPSQDADVLWGGAGTDTADYSKRRTSLRLSLDGQANDGVPASDGALAEGDNVQADVETLIGGSNTDFVAGNLRANRLEGGKGVDVLYGGGDADELLGGDDNDRLDGGSGNDRLHGGRGNDTLSGQNGDDAMIEGATPLGSDWFIGGGGRDQVDYSARTQPVLADNDGVAGDDGEDADGNLVSEERDRVSTDVEVLHGGSRGDRLTQWQDAGGTCTALLGRGGDDILRGLDGDDTLYGGPGADDMAGGRGDDYLIGGDGDDREEGLEGDDTFVQGHVDMDCAGPRYDHHTTGPDGADDLVGGDGEDQVVYYSRPAAGPVEVRLDGKANDGALGERDNAGVENVQGGAGDDLIVGSSRDNDLRGHGGDDTVYAGDGADHMFDRTGRDTLFGQGGSDVFDTQDGDGFDTLDGGSGVNDRGAWDDTDRVTAM